MSERNSGWAYRPALDGVRTLAVTAVVLYHLGYGWAQGGFLGVDTFFVLSGYLITSLLLLEWRNNETIRLLAFWGDGPAGCCPRCCCSSAWWRSPVPSGPRNWS